ncbi:hypothetical protein ACWGTI_26845 [Mesorhizobium sp. ArgA1]
MVDLGFLDKFEEYYGRRAAKGFVGLAAGGAVVVILGGAWTYVSPVVIWANTDGISWTEFAFRVFSFLLSVGALISVGTVFAQAAETRARQHQFLADFETMTEKLVNFTSGLDKAIGLQEETMAIYEESVGILEHLKDKQAAQSLRDTMKKSKENRDGMQRISNQAREMLVEFTKGPYPPADQPTKKPLTIENVAPDSQPNVAKKRRK